jgi:uncharacterized membrane protein
MPSAELPPSIVDPELCVVSRRNDSLGTKGRAIAFAMLASVSVAVALAWMVAGVWTVLPYSLAELAVVALAFRVVERRAADWERLVVVGDRLILERSRCGKLSRHELSRWRTRIEIEPRGTGCLLLRCADRSVAFGSDLPAHARRAAAQDLRRLTRL